MSEVSRATDLPVQLLGKLVDAIDDVVYVIDAAGDIVYWNERLEETTGYTPAELAAIDPADLMAPADRGMTPGMKQPIGRLDDRRVVLDILTADGEAIPHEFRGTTVENPETGAVYRCGIARDVSDRLARERELERYETIVESVDDGVYALDEEMTFEFVNDALCEMLGQSREELLGTDPRELFVGEEEVRATDGTHEQVVAGESTTGTVEAVAETPEGDRLELAVNYTPLGDAPDGAYPGSAGVIRDVTEQRRRQREVTQQRALLQGILNAIPDVVFAFDPEGEPLETDFLLDEFAGYSAAEMAELDPLELVPAEERDALAELLAKAMAEDRVFSRESALLTKDGDRIPYEFRGTRLTDDDGEVIGIVGTGRDVTERVERERALEQRRDELETLNRINELLLDITRELVEAPDRRALEQTVCERLATSALYRFAWIGERELDGGGLAFRVSAGADEGYVEELTIAPDDETGERGPAATALQSGTVQVVNVDDAFEPWRAAAEARDVRSVAAVPLVHGETVYGVLAVYATRPDAFSEREQAGFRVLGETIGFVINAVKRRKLLFADRVTELEFELTAGGGLLGKLAESVDAEVELAGFVDAGEGWLAYLDVALADPSPVEAALGALDRVRDARVVSASRDGVRVEAPLTSSTLLDAAASVGATVAGGTGTPTGTRITVDVPGDADRREAVELLLETLPEAALVAQRERDRQPGRPSTPDGPLDGLTARQREALQVAYRAGYYAWPRESTAEEIAETLDIAPSTLHAHLRKAEAGVLGDAVEEA